MPQQLLLCPLESQAILPLVVPPDHLSGHRSSLGQSEPVSVLSAISERFLVFSLIFQLQWFKSDTTGHPVVMWQDDSESGG